MIPNLIKQRPTLKTIVKKRTEEVDGYNAFNDTTINESFELNNSLTLHVNKPNAISRHYAGNNFSSLKPDMTLVTKFFLDVKKMRSSRSDILAAWEFKFIGHLGFRVPLRLYTVLNVEKYFALHDRFNSSETSSSRSQSFTSMPLTTAGSYAPSASSSMRFETNKRKSYPSQEIFLQAAKKLKSRMEPLKHNEQLSMYGCKMQCRDDLVFVWWYYRQNRFTLADWELEPTLAPPLILMQPNSATILKNRQAQSTVVNFKDDNCQSHYKGDSHSPYTISFSSTRAYVKQPSYMCCECVWQWLKTSQLYYSSLEKQSPLGQLGSDKLYSEIVKIASTLDYSLQHAREFYDERVPKSTPLPRANRERKLYIFPE
ncbi:hypothetical protein BDQ17DRAFT_1321024 [Cyathus striatus]|nr:hypothetical protein BDQ17DRAFT_1321024 [Cyathus striatus]